MKKNKQSTIKKITLEQIKQKILGLKTTDKKFYEKINKYKIQCPDYKEKPIKYKILERLKRAIYGNNKKKQKQVKKLKETIKDIPNIEKNNLKSSINDIENKEETKQITDTIAKKSLDLLKLKNKLKTGISGFDDLLDEGIPEGSSVLIEGGPGSGKTIFCLQLGINACMQGKKVLYMSFEEAEARLISHMKNFGFNPEKYSKQGLFMIKRFNALDIARSVEALLSEAKKELLIDIHPVLIPKEFNPDIVCIDSLSSISSAFSGDMSRFRIYMEQLFRYLELNNITSFLVREIAMPSHLGGSRDDDATQEAVSFLSDGIISLYNVIHMSGRRGRAIEIIKMRGENINRCIVESEIINKKGFVVYPTKQINKESRLT